MMISIIQILLGALFIYGITSFVFSALRAFTYFLRPTTRPRGAVYQPKSTLYSSTRGHFQRTPEHTSKPKAQRQAHTECKPVYLPKEASKHTSDGYSFSKKTSVVPMDGRFNWSDLPVLSFESVEAEPMTQQSEFGSMQHIGKAQQAKRWSRPQDGYLPHIQEDLTAISIDKTSFEYNKLFAKPDALFFDPNTNTYFVVEYKNRQFRGLHSLFPENVLQLITSAHVIQKRLSEGGYALAGRQPKVRCFMRLENKVSEVKGWESLGEHIWSMANDLMAALALDSTKSTDVANHLVHFDPVFKKQIQDNELRREQGLLKHYRMAKQAQSNLVPKAAIQR